MITVLALSARLLTEEESVTSEEEEDHDDVTEDEGDDDMMMDGGIPGLSGWMSTKKVIRSRFFGRAFKSKQKQKQEKVRKNWHHLSQGIFGLAGWQHCCCIQ